MNFSDPDPGRIGLVGRQVCHSPRDVVTEVIPVETCHLPVDPNGLAEKGPLHGVIEPVVVRTPRVSIRP